MYPVCIVYSEYTAHSIQHKCIVYNLYVAHIASELYFVYIKCVYKINILYVHYRAYIILHIYYICKNNKPFIYFLVAL